MSLHDAIISYTGIQSELVADVVTGLIFGVGILMVVALLTKFIFRIV